jgi:hypothetical protein
LISQTDPGVCLCVRRWLAQVCQVCVYVCVFVCVRARVLCVD